MKLDILAFGAHPDDVELGCGGILLRAHALGQKTGIVDLTRGELSTRGTPEIRAGEAFMAGTILGLAVRENLGLRDGFFGKGEEEQLKVIQVIRKYRPTVILVNAKEDRHPDHIRGGELLRTAAFLAGLRKIETEDEGEPQEAWRPEKVIHFTPYWSMDPNVIVDITPFFEQKIESIKAHESQFFDPNSTEPETYISGSEFFDGVESRARELGKRIGVTYGEGLQVPLPMRVDNLLGL